MALKEVKIEDQFEMNIDRGRIDKKVKILEMQARDRKKLSKKKKTELNKYIQRRTEELQKQFGL